jgi:hypothetical protein
MLDAMRKLYAKGDMIAASSIAEKAAPYVHPRLASVDLDHTSNGESVRFVVMGVPEIEDPNEWARRYRPKAITTQ